MLPPPHTLFRFLITHTAQWTLEIMLPSPTFFRFLLQVKEPANPQLAAVAYKIKSKDVSLFFKVQTALLPPTPLNFLPSRKTCPVQPLMSVHFVPSMYITQIHAGMEVNQFSPVHRQYYPREEWVCYYVRGLKISPLVKLTKTFHEISRSLCENPTMHVFLYHSIEASTGLPEMCFFTKTPMATKRESTHTYLFIDSKSPPNHAV